QPGTRLLPCPDRHPPNNGDAMPITRSTRLLRRTVALAFAPALVLTAAACGDDGGGSSEAFCDGANALNERFGTIEDPEAFGEALEASRQLDPPDEIADDWNAWLEAFGRIEDVDPDDPEALAALDFSDVEEPLE